MDQNVDDNKLQGTIYIIETEHNLLSVIKSGFVKFDKSMYVCLALYHLEISKESWDHHIETVKYSLCYKSQC